MAKEKGCKKTGGRQKGTPNKTTTITKQVIANLLSSYHQSGLMEKDFISLDPKDRLVIAERLMQYNLPKMQATSIDMTVDEKKKTIEETLSELSKEPDDTEN